MTTLTQARTLAMQDYPEVIRYHSGDTVKEMPCVVRRGIASGQFDRGRVVTRYLEGSNDE